MHVAEMGCPIGRENYDIIQVNETGTPFHAGKNHVDSPLESCRCVAKPERETTEPEDPWWEVNVVLSLSSGRTGICQYPLLQSRVVNMSASPRDPMHSSIRGRG